MKKGIQQASEADRSIFKKKIKKLAGFKGSGTELITQYIPPGADRSSVTSQLTEEMSQSSNIKDPTTRKNVQGALRKIINFLKSIDFKIPENGIVVFAGNISERDGRPDIRLFTLKPIERLTTKRYWCDSAFHLDPLEKMVKTTEIYGILTMDKREATVAILRGKKYDIVGHFTSRVHGKHRAGGQCLMPDSLVQLDDGAIIEIKETHNPLGVIGADWHAFKTTPGKIVGKFLTRKSNLVKITTKQPRTEIACSADHTLFKITNKGVAEDIAGNLKINDSLLMPEKIEVKGKIQNIEGIYFNSYKLSAKGIKLLINKRKKLNLSQKQLGKKRIHQASVSAMELGKHNPRPAQLKKYCTLFGIDYLEFANKYCKPNSTLKLPKILNKELAQFVGYFIGDGHIEDERVGFSESDKALAVYYEKFAKKLFNANTRIKFKKKKNYYQLRVNGKPIVRMLRSEFEEKRKAKNSSIPRKIMQSKTAIVAAFLKGLFDAEGYATSTRGVALGMNNKKLIQQLQMLLLRFGILSSVHEYDNRRNPYSDNHRFTLDITEQESLKLFKKHIGFTLKRKKDRLKKLLKKKSTKSRIRRIPVAGTQVLALLKEYGYNTRSFPKVSNFFNNNRMMSKSVFKKSIINYVQNKKLRKKLQELVTIPFVPVKISKIERLKQTKKLVDIETSTTNFIAQGLVVHNSAARFQRLHEESTQQFYREVSEKMKDAFAPILNELKGMIIAGPGITKEEFLSEGDLDYRIKDKVIGKLDTSYTDEYGIKEVVDRAQELLKDSSIVHEKGIIQGFLAEIAKNGLATYGERDVLEAIDVRKVSVLLLSEGIEKTIHQYTCPSCGADKILEHAQAKNETKCGKCGNIMELMEEAEYVDYLQEKAKSTGATTELISVETDEGKQFLTGFGGIAAMLRYK